MSAVSDIWAKSSKIPGGLPIHLHEHIQDVLCVFGKINQRVNIPLCELICLAIVCHDLGKVLPGFQIRTVKNKNYTPASPLIDFPHSLFSLLWIDEDKLGQRLPQQDADTYREFVLSAIAYHHWRESFFELISTSYSEIIDLLDELLRVKNDLEKNLKAEIQRLNSDWHELVRFDDSMAQGLCNGVPFSEYARPPYQLYFLPKRVGLDDKKMREWIFIAGFLQRADHFASFCEEEGEDVRTSEPEICSIPHDVVEHKVKEEIQKRQASKSGGSESIWQLEKIDSCKNKNVILVAPTGYGKTEFAFLWGSDEKFFYTLPLRAAVNQIYERAKVIFGEGKTGLLHSDADVFLLGDGGEEQASLKTYDLARQLAFPAIISTGDQFFPYALRPPGYEKIYATFSYSRLIIDEVQAYDPRAAAIVVKFMEDIVRMGGKFLLMTATLPEFVRKEIKSTIGESNFKEINLYEEKKGDFRFLTKHKINVKLIDNSSCDGGAGFSIPDDHIEEILDRAKGGKRVLVIANTVKQAQNIFQRLKELGKKDTEDGELGDKILLLHSRFTQADRSELETKICGNKGMNGEFQNPKPDSDQEGKILVATQVVEASLDIDADVLFTETAPMDALVQRMGRVLRRYGPMASVGKISEPAEPNIIVWVFKNGLQSGKGYVYDNDLVVLTLKFLKDKDGSVDDCKSWFSKIRKNKGTVSELISSALEDLFGDEIKNRENKRKRKKSKSSGNDNPQISRQAFELVCSEFDKYELVKKLYESLPDDSSYLSKFSRTKDILDAGYMSDRKEEAHELFRDIHTVSIIPSEKKKEFLEEIIKFLGEKDKNRFYTWFKKEVLAKFVVQVPLREKEGERLVSDWLTIQGINEEEKSKLVRWCRDMYFVNYPYDKEKGLEVNPVKNRSFIL